MSPCSEALSFKKVIEFLNREKPWDICKRNTGLPAILEKLRPSGKE
jgi:hypothetical protein